MRSFRSSRSYIAQQGTVFQVDIYYISWEFRSDRNPA